jgi:phage terminase large subunit GpA-like protein
MRFPNDYDDEFFKQMTAEEWRPPENGRRFGRWETIRDRNEALDCAVYNLAMWYKLEMYRFTSREYDALEESLAKQPKTQKSRPSAAKQRSSRLLSKGVVL